MTDEQGPYRVQEEGALAERMNGAYAAGRAFRDAEVAALREHDYETGCDNAALRLEVATLKADNERLREALTKLVVEVHVPERAHSSLCGCDECEAENHGEAIKRTVQRTLAPASPLKSASPDAPEPEEPAATVKGCGNCGHDTGTGPKGILPWSGCLRCWRRGEDEDRWTPRKDGK